jgi:hypothetical protein
MIFQLLKNQYRHKNKDSVPIENAENLLCRYGDFNRLITIICWWGLSLVSSGGLTFSRCIPPGSDHGTQWYLRIAVRIWSFSLIAALSWYV